MTNAKKARLVDLIQTYGTYQYLIGKAYEKREEKADEMAFRIERLAEVCQQMKDEFGIETWDLYMSGKGRCY